MVQEVEQPPENEVFFSGLDISESVRRVIFRVNNEANVQRDCWGSRRI